MTLKLGFCPTMRDAAEDFAQNREGVFLAPFGSAAEVLQGLGAGRIDFAIVGRKAEASEAGGLAERRLEAEAYTLVGPEKGFIQEAELNGLQARTCLGEVVVRNEFPELEKLVYAGAEDCRYDDGNVWLISWNEYTDGMRLLIPVNEHGAKIPKYRTPFLYSKGL